MAGFKVITEGLGEIATARLLTVSQTCRMQGRSALTYLGNAVASHRRGVSPHRF
ncbi:MAG: hypothetical protein ACYCPD_02940 [Acidobacteriaceae bacterium]